MNQEALKAEGRETPVYHMNNHGFAPRYWDHAKHLARLKYDGRKVEGRMALLHVDSHFDVNFVNVTRPILRSIQSRRHEGGEAGWEGEGRREKRFRQRILTPAVNSNHDLDYLA